MLKYLISCLLCLVPLLLSNCKASHQDNTNSKNLHSAVKSYLGESYQIDYNSSKTFALCQEKRQDDHLSRNFKYAIVRLSDLSIVNQDTFQNGYVKWISDDSVEVASTQGNRSESITKKIISIKSSQ